MIIRYYTLLLLSLFTHSLKAQEVVKSPDLLMMGVNSMAYYTPSYFEKGNDFKLNIGNEGGLGDFSPVRNFYGYFGSVNVAQDGHSSKASLYFSSERQGPFIQYNSFRVDYARRLVLNDGQELAFGISGGMMNLHIKSSASTGGSSNWLPDLYASLTYYRNSWMASISGGQLLNKTMTGFFPPIYFRRHYHFVLNKSFQWNGSMSTSAFYRCLLNSQFDNEMEWQVRQYFSKNYFVGAYYRRVIGTGIIAGVEDVLLNEHKFSFALGYQFSALHRTLANTQKIHVFLSYSLPK